MQYTQTEPQSFRADLQHRRDEDVAIRRIQQAQLDSLQVQVRDLAQQQSELSQQLTEVANAVTDIFQQVEVFRDSMNQAMRDVLPPFSCQLRN